MNVVLDEVKLIFTLKTIESFDEEGMIEIADELIGPKVVAHAGLSNDFHGEGIMGGLEENLKDLYTHQLSP